MAKYRKKPVEVEATQFEVDHILGIKPMPSGVVVEREGDPKSLEGQRVRYYVVTIQHQKVYIQPGEWVITEPDGHHHYPCADEVFRKSFDPL